MGWANICRKDVCSCKVVLTEVNNALYKIYLTYYILCLPFPLFLICTIGDKIIWHIEGKSPQIMYFNFFEEAPSVDFKLPNLRPVDPQESVIPVEHLGLGLYVIFWKILTCVPDVEAAVKDLLMRMSDCGTGSMWKEAQTKMVFRG